MITKKELEIKTTYPLFEPLDIYVVDDDKNIEYIKLADIDLYSQRLIDHRNLIAPIPFHDNERKYLCNNIHIQFYATPNLYLASRLFFRSTQHKAIWPESVI